MPKEKETASDAQELHRCPLRTTSANLVNLVIDDLFAKRRLLEDSVSIAAALQRFGDDRFGEMAEDVSLADRLDKIYRRRRLACPSEFVLKNELLNRIFLARHDPRRATVLTEMRVGRNRVDLVVVNKSTTAYEIKSRFDSLARLSTQVRSYQAVFDKVYVACDPGKVEGVIALVDSDVGIIAMNCSGVFRVVRKAGASPRLDHAMIFNCMRKPEFQAIARRRFGSLPVVPNMFERATYLALFKTLPVSAFHEDFASILQLRGMHPSDSYAMQTLPYSMRIRYYELPIKSRSLVRPSQFHSRAYTQILQAQTYR